MTASHPTASTPSASNPTAPNHPRPVTEPDRYGYRPTHDEEQPCLGCGRTVTYSADIGSWWIPYEAGNPPRGTFDCTNTTFVRHYGSPPRFNPTQINRDTRLRLIADLLSSLDLYVGKQHLRNLTTEQKEIYADLVDADAFWKAREDPTYAYPTGIPPRTARWWREDYDGPTSPDDPRWHRLDWHEPDPFRE